MRPAVRDVLSRLRSLSTAIDHLDQVAAEQYGLNRTDMRALDLIGQAGPLAPTELARLVGFTTGGITTVVDRLERAGYVRRVHDLTDRRRLLIKLTEATARRDDEVFGDLVRASMDAIDAYGDSDLAAIGAFLDRIRTITAHHADALAQGIGGGSSAGHSKADTTS